MIVDVLRLKDGVSERVAEVLDAKMLDLEYVDLHYKNKIQIEGSVERILNTLTFRGLVSRRIEHICARCLKAVEENIEDPLNLTYEISGLDEVDMSNDIRDVLLLSHPDRFLCAPNCKGLCSHCGVDLNVEQCSYKGNAPETNNPFSGLKSWLKK